MAVDAPAAAAPANAPEDKEDTDLEDEQNNISDEPIVSPVDAIAARRPRRASAMDVTYAEPEDIPVTVHDLC